MAFWALASGVVGELNNIQREKAKIAYEEQKRSDDFDYAVKTARAEADITLETEQKKIEMLAGQQEDQNLLNIFQHADNVERARLLQIPGVKARLGEMTGIDGFGSADLASLLASVDGSSLFGTTNIMGFEKVTDDKEAYQNLGQLSYIVGNPTVRQDLLDKFKVDTAGAEQLVNFIDTELARRGQYIYLNKSGIDDTTKEIKSPVFATFDEYRPLLSFREELVGMTGVETRTQRHVEVDNAIERLTEGKGVASDEIFVSQRMTGPDGNVYLGGTVIKEASKGYARELEELAKANGFANRHVMINNISSIGVSDDPVDAMEILREHTIPLKNAGADQLLTAKGALPNVVDEVSRLLVDVSPTDNTAEQVNALVAMIPLPESYQATFGVRGSYPTGADFLKTRAIKADEMISKNTFANNASESINAIIANYAPNENNGSIKTGAAGLLQRVGLGIFASGGQVDQLFGGFDPATDFEEGTTAASLAKVVSDVTGKSLTDKLGENDALMIALAYQMARAEDSNGRLSDADLKIQLDLLKGQGFFDNRNITLAKLNTLKTKFERIKQDTDYYAGVARNTNGVSPLEAREFDAYVIVEKARKHRRRQTVSATGGTDTRIRFNEDDYKPATQDFVPVDGSEFFYGDGGVLYERKDGSDFVTKVPTNDNRIKLRPTEDAGQAAADAGQAAAENAGEAPAENVNEDSENNQAQTSATVNKDVVSFTAQDLAGIPRKPLANGNFEIDVGGQMYELKPIQQKVGDKTMTVYQPVVKAN